MAKMEFIRTSSIRRISRQRYIWRITPPPKQAIILLLILTYLVKIESTYKDNSCCNGSPRKYGSSSIVHKYDTVVSQPGSPLFLDLAAINNLLVYGSNASNAFAEAPHPVNPFYISIETNYWNWWKRKADHTSQKDMFFQWNMLFKVIQNTHVYGPPK